MKNLIILLLSISFACSAQQVTELLSGTDVSGATLQIDAKLPSGVVLFFTSVRCPYDDHYLSRMNDLNTRFGRNFRFYFVNSSQEDTPAAIQSEVNARGSQIPYMIDQPQKLKKALGVSKTTEVVVLRPEKGGFSIFYKGPVDDNPQVAADADHSFLKDALEAYLTGKPAVKPGARVTGCLIREQ